MWMRRYAKRASPVTPIRIFMLTDDESTPVRDDINRGVYCCVTKACKLASGVYVVMKIHEYQAKAILAHHGVPVPRGEVAFNSAEAGDIAKRLGGSVVVVKAQIHAGGRGKGGGVKLAKSPADAVKLATDMIGMTLVTHQTGPEGRVVTRVLVEEGLQMTRELYLSIVLDRGSGKPVMMASAAGGMDIEEVAASSPEKIARVYIEPGAGLVPFQARQLG